MGVGRSWSPCIPSFLPSYTSTSHQPSVPPHPSISLFLHLVFPSSPDSAFALSFHPSSSSLPFSLRVDVAATIHPLPASHPKRIVRLVQIPCSLHSRRPDWTSPTWASLVCHHRRRAHRTIPCLDSVPLIRLSHHRSRLSSSCPVSSQARQRADSDSKSRLQLDNRHPSHQRRPSRNSTTASIQTRRNLLG